MDLIRRRAAERAPLGVTETVRRDALGTVLHVVGAQALHQISEAPPGSVPDVVSGPCGPVVPARRAAEIDADAVADWFVGQLTREPCGAVVIGSPHGSALHLATAIGAPWLPAGFETVVHHADDDPDRPLAALTFGEATAARILRGNDGVTVRQVHEPVMHRGRADGVQFTVRWRTLPPAYREYLDQHLVPGGSVIMVRDVGRWPVIRSGDRYSFQLGNRGIGLAPIEFYRRGDGLTRAIQSVGGRGAFDGALPAFHDGDGDRSVEGTLVDEVRWWAMNGGRRLRQVLYRRPEVLSASVADLYRLRLRHAGRTGNRLVVECGRLVAPWHVLRAGLVPYWCEHPLDASVAAIEWWLGGSDQFSSVEVLPEPPGASLPAMAQLTQWGSVASFAGRRGLVDERCARSYPLGTVAARHAATVLGQYPYDMPVPAPLTPDSALSAIAEAGETSGLLVL